MVTESRDEKRFYLFAFEVSVTLFGRVSGYSCGFSAQKMTSYRTINSGFIFIVLASEIESIGRRIKHCSKRGFGGGGGYPAGHIRPGPSKYRPK